MPQNKSNHNWEIVVSSIYPHGYRPSTDSKLTILVADMFEKISAHPNVKSLVIGEEIGLAEKKLHYHVVIILHKTWCDATVRNKVSNLKLLSFVRVAVAQVKKLTRMLAYTCKEKIFKYYGYPHDELIRLGKSWLPEKEYKKNKSTGLVKKLLDKLNKNCCPINGETVVDYVVDYYADNYKSVNRHHLKSVCQGILNCGSQREKRRFKESLVQELLY